MATEMATKVRELLEAAAKEEGSSGQLSVDTLRRKLKTTKAAVQDAISELEGAGIVEFDEDDQIAQMVEDVKQDEGTAGVNDPYINPETGDEDTAPKFRFPDRKKAEYEEKGGNCGDRLAEALTAYLNDTQMVPRKDGKGEKKVKGIDMHALRQVAEANGITDVKGNNPGQMRMNLSNMLRSKWRKGTAIVVGDLTIPGLANYKTPQQWREEYAKALIAETTQDGKPTLTSAAAMAQAEQAFEAKAAAMEYSAEEGRFLS